MHLINVESVLRIEASRELQPETEVLKRFSDSELQGLEYAILSHCWSTKEGEEIGFEEMVALGKKHGREALQERQSYKKIVDSCDQARRDGLLWLWVDTCCIDEPERAEALKLMYQWYQQSTICYAYLHDLVGDTLPTGDGDCKPRWFFRGWTLQELVAPRVVLFFNQDWDLIGDKGKLGSALTRITKIPGRILAAERFPHPDDPCRPSAAQIMSWAADRKTTKTEDRAYSLMGLFEVHMEMRYGERERAFYRLQEAILEKYNDHSIFAWFGKERPGNVLADDPSDFGDSADVLRMDPAIAFNDSTSEVEVKGIRIEQRHAKARLLITRCLGSSYHFQATLACCRKPAEGQKSTPLTIILAVLNKKHYRVFGDFKPSNEKELRKVYLFCRPIALDPYFTFEFKVPQSIKLKHDLLQHGDNSPRLPGIKDGIIHYVTADGDKASLVISVGRSLGQDLVHVHVVPSGGHLSVGIDDGEQLYHVNRIAQLRNVIKGLSNEFPLFKHAHIPGTIQAVELEYKRQPGSAFVELKVISCTGCCVPIWRPHKGMNDWTRRCFQNIRVSYFSLYGVPPTAHSSTVVGNKSDLERQQKAILKFFVTRIPLLKELPTLERLLRGERALMSGFFERTEKKNHLEAEALAWEKLGISITHVMSKVKDQLLKRNAQVHRVDGNAIGLFACPGPGTVGEYILELHEKTEQLRAELDSTDNDFRKQALEEDIVGRILLLSWCGLEATQVDHEGIPVDAREKIHRTSVSYLLRIAFMETTDASLSLDGQCPLERVMADAAADISKSGLLDDSHEG